MKKLAILALVIGVVAAACGGSSGSSDDGGDTPTTAASSGDAANGKVLFDGTCVSCHGADAKGLPGLGKDMTTSEFIKGTGDQDLLAFVKVGRPVSDPANTTGVDMPAKGGNPSLSDQDILDIIAYIRTLSS